MAIEDEQQFKRLFVSNVLLPFGSSANAFNRISRACHTIGVRLFGLVWNNYYDDFPQLDLVAFQGDAQATAEGLFELIGWRVSLFVS